MVLVALAVAKKRHTAINNYALAFLLKCGNLSLFFLFFPFLFQNQLQANPHQTNDEKYTTR